MTGIDSRAWLAWAVAAMIPALLGRNPIVLAELLCIVLVVHVVWADAATFAGLRWFVRLAALFTIIGVIFNVLTVHAGTLAFAHLPREWPVIGGALTVNALVFGLASGFALLTLVLIGTTVASLVNWMDFFHAMPSRLAPIAVAGSVAWGFLPQSAVAFRQIRESQEMRGHRIQGARGLLPLIMPLLAGALERALATAEALEARGFGASPDRDTERAKLARFTPGLMIGGMVVLVVGAFSALTGYVWIGLTGLAVGAGMLGSALRSPRGQRPGRTRYRRLRWSGRDTAISSAATVSGVATLLASWMNPEALRFDPYPDLLLPRADVPLMIAIAFLMVPALLATTPLDDPKVTG